MICNERIISLTFFMHSCCCSQAMAALMLQIHAPLRAKKVKKVEESFSCHLVYLVYSASAIYLDSVALKWDVFISLL